MESVFVVLSAIVFGALVSGVLYYLFGGSYVDVDMRLNELRARRRKRKDRIRQLLRNKDSALYAAANRIADQSEALSRLAMKRRNRDEGYLESLIS